MAPGRSPRRTRSQSRSRTRSGSRSGSQSRSESRGRSFKAKSHVKKVQVQSGRIRKITKPPPKRWFQLFTESTTRTRRSRGSTTLTTAAIKTARGTSRSSSRSRQGGSKLQQKRGRSRRRIADDDYDDEDEDDKNDIADEDEDNDTGGRGGGYTDHDMKDVSASASEDDNPVVDLKKFKKLWETKHRTYNFTLTCEQTNFRVHRHVLCARSTILCRMFKSNFTKDNIGHIMDHRATPTVVAALIEWIYTNKIAGRLKGRDLCGLVGLADRYELQDLVDTALSMVCTKAKLEIQCVGLILEVTDARDLTKACENNLSAFCKTNLSRLIHEKEFMDNIRSHRIYHTFNESQREVVRRKARSNQAKKSRLDRERERKREAYRRGDDDDDDDDDEYEEEETDQKRRRVVRINAN